MKRTSSAIAVATTLFTATLPATVAAMNTAQIAASALTQDCISWRVSGVCYWLFCSMFGCTVKTSVKVTHFIPEVVVSTYGTPGGNPWKEMALVSKTSGGMENLLTSSLTGFSADGGNPADMKNPKQRDTKLRFKYADAIGHPATSTIGGSVPGYSCSTAATPFMPYFLSPLDVVAWRLSIPETLYPEALIPGSREVGSQLSGNMWGAVYPRSGFIHQVDDDKAAAVVAQRVADIITRSGQAHVYQTLKGNRKDGYWPPDPVEENNARNHKWQRLAPQMSRQCAVFPDGSHSAASDNTAAFALWQPYSCCQRRGQRFLTSTNF
ncbi:TIGR03756 family integrating conjugative element protein [Serratia microhaemolytica]|uniref:TIGR03756 family integrating conjugative element protein n=1 Tax=Serratia microhaemolytica TaxID=2675110 RepID=UPI000FDE36CC|nr:TIGR03756 family integrating conjugative element protein [Serratia microhaemolytica]